MRFIKVALLSGNIKTAQEVLLKLENSQGVKSTPSVYVSALVLRTMLEILNGSIHSAARTIEDARETNHANYHLASDVQIRGLESAIALKKGDYAIAEQLAERNIKWLRTRRISLSTSAWTYFYQIIESIIRHKQTGESIRPNLLKHFRNDFQSEHPDFYLLLRPELENA